MINLDRIELALSTLIKYYQFAFKASLFGLFNPHQAAKARSNANRLRCAGIVIHDRILTEGRFSHEYTRENNKAT
ncbi:hypothetical protein vBEcoMRo157lw_00079 [Escherichia phage vB_EcoM-Ro157lw]|uniref:Uncharacterized protein n=1 Tax=Escherichia phage vB_EcoM-Ro157lw TaxID=2144177 RepID=A0A494RA73_9CAUD|nr:hypothetical protein vBEcoMRo157lw_00079 [Escherichia phage vB_EcoM-Ro157lw]